MGLARLLHLRDDRVFIIFTPAITVGPFVVREDDNPKTHISNDSPRKYRFESPPSRVSCENVIVKLKLHSYTYLTLHCLDACAGLALIEDGRVFGGGEGVSPLLVTASSRHLPSNEALL